MSITNIEDKLYHTNFKSEHTRLNTYLSVHATLLKNKEVPRVYIQNKDHDFESIAAVLDQIIFNDLNHVVENTNKHLAILGVSTKSLTDLSHDDKTELISLIEDLLLNGWGSGKIHYEYPRVYPLKNCELLRWIEILNINNEKLFKLKEILRKRQSDSQIFQVEQDKIFSSGFRRYHPTVLSKSYQLLIEKQWKNNWAHHSNYDVLNNNSFPNLVIVEDL
jgi:hypothetical protein